MKVNKTQMFYDSIMRLSRIGATAHIRKLLAKSHPSEIAAVVRQVSTEEGVELIVKIKACENEPATFVELESLFFKTYLEITGDKDHVVEILQKLPENQVASLLASFSDEIRQEFLSLMKSQTQQEVVEILNYAEDSCGRIMAVNVFSLDQNMTADGAINAIQKSSNLSSIFYIYVINEFGHLVGVVSMKQVLQVDPSRQLKDFMTTDVVRVNVFDSQQKAARFIEEYNFVSLPVTDDQGKLMGVITVDDVIDYIRDEAHEEVLQLAGVEPEGLGDFSYFRAFSSRILWYVLLFAGGIISSEIIFGFFATFPKEIYYLCFAPIVLRLGGSIATQNITFIDQGILKAGIGKSRALEALWGQNLVTFLVATLSATSVVPYAYYRLGVDASLAWGMGLALMFVVLIAIIFGIVMPFFVHRLRLDTLQFSSRFVHFLMDALSLYIYFEFLWLWKEKMS